MTFSNLRQLRYPSHSTLVCSVKHCITICCKVFLLRLSITFDFFDALHEIVSVLHRTVLHNLRQGCFLGKVPLAERIVAHVVSCGMQSLSNRGFLIHRISPSMFHFITAVRFRPLFFRLLVPEIWVQRLGRQGPDPLTACFHLTRRKFREISGSLMLIRC